MTISRSFTNLTADLGSIILGLIRLSGENRNERKLKEAEMHIYW